MDRFVSIIQVDREGNEHRSTLVVTADGHFRALGVIPHNAKFRPASSADAEILLAAVAVMRGPGGAS